MLTSSIAFASENAQAQKFQENKHGCFIQTDLMKNGKFGPTNGVTIFWTISKRRLETDMTLR